MISSWKELLGFLGVVLLSVNYAHSLSCYRCGTLSDSARLIEDCKGPARIEECGTNEVCVVFKRLYKKGSESIRGCFNETKSLPGLRLIAAKSDCVFQPEKRSSVKACSCSSNLCNDKDYELGAPEPPAQRPRTSAAGVPALRRKVGRQDVVTASRDVEGISVAGLGVENDSGEESLVEIEEDPDYTDEEDYDESLFEEFLHHVQNSTINITSQEPRVPRQSSAEIECYQCGSLKKGDSAPCDHFRTTNPYMKKTCEPGEGCLLYTWMKSSSERGMYRECYPLNQPLGPSESPINVAKSCELQPTQRDKESRIYACLCDTPLCNDVPKLTVFGATTNPHSPTIQTINNYTTTHRPNRRGKKILGDFGKTTTSTFMTSSLRERLAIFMSEFGATPTFNFNQHGPIDCKWSDFSSWSTCSQSCNGGVQFRERKILILSRQGGTPCRGERRESRVCNTHQCPPDFVGNVPKLICPLINVLGATYANCDGRYKVTTNKVPWAPERPVYKHTRKNRYIFWNAGGLGWSIGKREYLKTGSHWHRSGLNTQEPWQGQWEEGVLVECVGSQSNQQEEQQKTSATEKPGPVNCVWSGYGQWSRCSVSCGVGTQQRKRMVLQPASNGGKGCEGDAIQSRKCNARAPCPVNCEWSNYGKWSKCSATCGGGNQTRRRNVRRRASGGGRPCSGRNSETRDCNTNPCAVSCEWSEFTPWSKCSSTCGNGLQRRFRTVVQEAQGGGTPCDPKDAFQIQECIDEICPTTITSTLTTETPTIVETTLTTTVSSTSVVTTTTKNISFANILFQGLDETTTNPPDFSFANDSSSLETSTTFIPSTISTTTLVTTTTPSTTTTSSTTTRSTSTTTTTVTTFTPSLVKAPFKKPIELQIKNPRLSDSGKIDCRWSEYGQWTDCSKECGVGVQARNRSLLREARNGGRECQGRAFQTRLCNRHLCGSGADLCCERVVVKASGNAKLDQSLYLGIYTKVSENYNGRIAYEREGREQLYIYFFLSKADNLNLWVIGPELGQFIAGIRNDGQETCIHEAHQRWKYASRAGVWKDDDSTLKVECFSNGDTQEPPSNSRTKQTTTRLPVTRPPRSKVDCKWGPYGDWTRCSKSCGRGIQFRNRKIVQAPKNGGANCRGSNRESQACNSQPCSSFSTTLPPTTTTRRTTTTLAPRRRRPPPPSNPNRRVKCFACGSLFSTNAPECDKFDVSNSQQQTLCDVGEACLWYSYHKSAGDVAIIRECFAKTILLGNIADPIVASDECVPRPVEDDSITACICTSDYCNGYDGGRPVNLESTTTTPTAVAPVQTESPRSQGGTKKDGSQQVLCHQCGSLFSGSGNPPCEEEDAGTTDYCKVGEACLWYSWKKSNIETSIIRECFSKSILLGSIDKPLQLRHDCQPQDISETRGSNIFACLCDTDKCNANLDNGGIVDDDTFVDQRQTTARRPTTSQSRTPTTTRRSTFSQTSPSTSFFQQSTPPPPKRTFSGGPGLQCYSCGSLLNPDKKCDNFNPSDPTQIQTCKSGEACLLYKWKKSSVETAILRECFSTSVLLGSFDNPLTATETCGIRDISEPDSSSIEACLCTTDFCNDELGRSPGSSANLKNENRQSTRNQFKKTTTSPVRNRFSQTTAPNFFERTTKSSTFFSRASTQSSNFFDRQTTKSSDSRQNIFGELPNKLKLNTGNNRRTSCPRGYTLLQTGCYKISQRRMGWIEAKKKCESENGNLVAIDDEEERDALFQLISESSPRTRFEYWLGGNDIEIENRWVWTGFGNTKLVPDFGWLDRPVPSDEENCLTWSITLSRKGSRRPPSEGWHSDSCCNDIRFICELK